MSFQRFSERVNKFFESSQHLVVMLVGITVALLSHPYIFMALRFESIGVNQWWQLGVGAGMVLSVATGIFVRIIREETMPYVREYIVAIRRFHFKCCLGRR